MTITRPLDPRQATVPTDGATIDTESLVTPDSVDRAVYLDRSVFEAELTRIFRRTWVYVGHESQVGQPGDFVTTRIGADPVILVRDEEGALRVLFNRCMHRGAVVCHDRHGSTTFFRCPYHGWTYRTSGAIAGVTFPAGYGGRLEEVQASMNLEPVAGVESYQGFVFAHVEQPRRSLQEHLQPALGYLDRFVASVPGRGVQLVDPPYRYCYQGNWKFQVENAVDGYHPAVTHASFIKVMAARTGNPRNPYQRDNGPVRVKSLGGGHTVLDLMKARTAGVRTEEYGDSYLERARMTPRGTALVAQLEDLLGPADARSQLEGDNDFNLAIFPNLMIIQSQVRVVYPMSPSRTDIFGWATVGRDAHPLVNELRLRMQELFNGPSGMGSPDDLEMFERCQVGLAGGNETPIRFLRGLDREEVDGSVVTGRGSDETPFRGLYREWARLMRGENAADDD